MPVASVRKKRRDDLKSMLEVMRFLEVLLCTSVSQGYLRGDSSGVMSCNEAIERSGNRGGDSPLIYVP